MEQKLLRKLMKISDEERAILDGSVEVSRDIYSTESGFVVNARKLLPPGSLIVVRTHTRFIHFPSHTHNYVEIVYMYSGTTTHIVEGEHRVTLKPGEFLFISRGAAHEILPADEGDIAVNFIILPKFFDKALPTMEGENLLGNFIAGSMTANGSGVSYLHFRTGDVLTVKNLAENLIWSLTNKENYQNSINQSTMGLLFQHLLNNTDKLSHVPADSAGYEHTVVMDVLRYIEDNYTEASLSEYAERARLPLYQLSRMISRQMGRSFKEILLNRRMAQAEFLLRETKTPVEEIIPAVGYENTSYFYRVFKRRQGMTPRGYRERHSAE
ncbi:MAG: AraC family transcriptional regulator [Clostridiales Family XIII bacterium]|jgi:AraC-like DNA-binding protein/mannose-6-phosphate isomerase-like protein (cupin superfamily)|nr:AraC family transcriptional regulator [Clostridiales Family XIII bacterium]